MAVLDQTTVFNEFTTIIPEEVKTVLRPHIIGPQGELHRYTDPEEKPGIDLGSYDNLLAHSFPWPGKSAGSVVDLAYSRVFIDAALLRFFQDNEGGGSGTITAVSPYPNRIITTAADGFKENGAFVRDALLKDRDVQIGDVVHVKHLSEELYTTVRSLIGDVIPATIDAATTDAANPATQLQSESATQTSGTVNDITALANGTLYAGLGSGFINETYTVLVTQGSTGGDATTALLDVASASGLDNQTGVTPAAFASPTAIGTRGLTVTWSNIVNDFVVGQTWTVTVSQAFTKPVPTSGGTYTGTQTLTYIIRVTLGAKYTDPTKPQISVTTDLGIDQSGPTTVTAAATNVPAGTLGVVVQFSGTALRKDDVYYIVANAPEVGAYKTIELNDNLSTALQAAPDMLLELSIQQNLEVPQRRESSPPDLNWTTSQSGITINDGIDATDDSLTDLGVGFFVPVISGPSTTVYAHFRAWSLDNTNTVGEISDPDLITAALGPVTPDNPLAYAVNTALANANARTVNYTGIVDPDDATAWDDAIAILEGLAIYSVVPLTTDAAVQTALQVHVDAQSEDDVGGWRVDWIQLPVVETKVIVDITTTSDLLVALATLVDDPGTAGTQYTYLTCTTGNAKFVTNGVRAGDIVRFLFSINAFGDTIWSEFTVETVVNEATLILALPGNAVAVNVAQKVEVWRNLTRNEIAQDLAARCEAIADKRVRCVWPDQIDTVDGLVPGFHAAAAIAGFMAGVAPHQGIEGVPLSGFTGASRSTSYFSNAQLNILRNAGFFVITQVGSDVVVRNALTSDQSSLENGLEVVGRNDDAIRRVIHNRVSQFFGVANLTEAGLTIIRSEIETGFFVLQSNTFVNRLGNMIVDKQIIDIRASTTIPDQVIVQANVTRPFPVDSLGLNLIFG